MARHRLPVLPHLAPDEIARRYRSCRDGREGTHRQLLWLPTRADPAPSPARAAEQVGLTPSWARTILERWDARGPDGLADRRKATDGGQAKLTPAQRAELFAAPQRPPPDGGLWAGPKVAAFTLRVPGPAHPEAATPAERRAWGRCPGRAGRQPAPR